MEVSSLRGVREWGAEGWAQIRMRGHELKFGEGVTAVSARHRVPREGFSRAGGGFYYYDR